MRVLFIGAGEFALPTLRWLAGSEYEVPLVVTQPARPSGRGRRRVPTPVRVLADELGIESLEAEDVNAAEVVNRLRSLEARLGVVVAFGQKLGTEVLESTPEGCINLHASLLPRYRGAAPINWAIINGETQTGCTVFRVVQRMDAGPVLTVRRTDIDPQETAGELHDRLSLMGAEAVAEALKLYGDGKSPRGTPQDDGKATQAPKLKKAEGRVDFNRPAIEVVNHIRGMTPWPGAAACFQSADGRWERVTLTRARRVEHTPATRGRPGTIDERGYVATAEGCIEIMEIQPSSGRIMTWRDYVNGRHVKAGDLLVSPNM